MANTVCREVNVLIQTSLVYFIGIDYIPELHITRGLYGMFGEASWAFSSVNADVHMTLNRFFLQESVILSVYYEQL